MIDTVQLPPEFFEVHERIEIAKQAAEFGIFDFDIVKGTMYCDQNSRKIYGISPDLPVTVETFVATVHPDDRLKCYPYLKEPLDLSRNALLNMSTGLSIKQQKRLSALYQGKSFF
jgi:hypothetical protein